MFYAQCSIPNNYLGIRIRLEPNHAIVNIKYRIHVNKK